GRPPSWWARIAGSRPARAIPLQIVVLSPPGITRPSRSSRSSGTRTSTASAPSPRSIERWASKSPWSASTPTRRSGPAVLEQRVGGGELADLEPDHRLADTGLGGGDPLRIGEVGGRLDDRPRHRLGVGAL